MLLTAPNLLKSVLVSELRDLVGEVVLSLFDALALFVEVELSYGDGGTQLFGGIGNVLTDGHAVIKEELLLVEADLLIVLAELTDNDFFKNVLGLVGVLRIVLRLMYVGGLPEAICRATFFAIFANFSVAATSGVVSKPTITPATPPPCT